MSSIEDRLRLDARNSGNASTASWDNVVERVEEHGASARRINRSMSALFICVLAAVAALLSSDILVAGDTLAITPLDAPPLPTPGVALPGADEASPLVAIAAWLIPWGGAAAAIALAFLASPRDFRAPFFIDRAQRFGVAVSFAILWASIVLAVALAGLALSGWQPFLWTYLEAVTILRTSIILGFLFWTLADSGYKTVLLVAALVGSGLLTFYLTGTVLKTEAGWIFGVAIAALFGVLAQLNVRRLGFNPEPWRLRTEALKNHSVRQLIGAVMVLLGTLTVGGALSQAAVFQTHLLELAQGIDGFDIQARNNDGLFLFHSDHSPTLEIFGQPQQSEQALIDDLVADGFVIVEPFTDVLTRQRGDAFDATVVEIAETVNFSADNESAFEVIRIVRNVGYAFVIAGLVTIWSETAISRFLQGSNPWRRQAPQREAIGWFSIIQAALLMFAFAWFESTVLVFVGVLMLWALGTHLLVPKPPDKPAHEIDPIST